MDKVSYFVEEKGGSLIDDSEGHTELSITNYPETMASYLARINNIGGKYGLERVWLGKTALAKDFDEGAVVEIGFTDTDGVRYREYYVVEDKRFLLFAERNFQQ